MKMLEDTKLNNWYIRSGKFSILEEYCAWGSLQKLIAENPLEENISQDVWFEFGKTREEAVGKLIDELNGTNNNFPIERCGKA
jgi:hypothetical protein